MNASEIIGNAIGILGVVFFVYLVYRIMKDSQEDTKNTLAYQREHNAIFARIAAALETANDLAANELEKDSQK